MLALALHIVNWFAMPNAMHTYCALSNTICIGGVIKCHFI